MLRQALVDSLPTAGRLTRQQVRSPPRNPLASGPPTSRRTQVGSQFQRRTYIFLPSTWPETKHLLRQAWNTDCKQERSAIFVKLLSKRSGGNHLDHRRKNLTRTSIEQQQARNTLKATQRDVASIQSPRLLSESPSIIRATHGNQGRRQITKRRLRRGVLQAKTALSPSVRKSSRRDSSLYVYYTATKQALRRRLNRFSGYYYKNRRRLRLRLRLRLGNLRPVAKTTPQPSTRRTTVSSYFPSSRAVRAKWKWVTRRIYLDEPFESTWFDPHGFPLTSQTPFGRYVNPWNSLSTNGMQSLLLFLRWRLERLWKRIVGGEDVSADSPTLVVEGDRSDPNVRNAARAATGDGNEPTNPNSFVASSTQPINTVKSKIRLTWIGHSTCMVRLDDTFTVLTDPHFSPCASPIQQWPFGVARDVPPALSMDELPDRIDVCVISHDHYDHLDQESIMGLHDRVSVFAVPLGTKGWLQSHGGVEGSKILELGWWESARVAKGNGGFWVHSVDDDAGKVEDTGEWLTLTCAPAQHWCGRHIFDRNQRLWCSWAFSTSASTRFYFGGDTGFPSEFPLFRQIGDRLGPFDLAALPIGAYSPRYFMRPSHVDPWEAVMMHEQLRAKKSVAIHHGTFRLAEEALAEPRRLLEEVADEHGVDFCAVDHGGVVEVLAESCDEEISVVVDGGDTDTRDDGAVLVTEDEKCSSEEWGDDGRGRRDESESALYPQRAEC